MNLDRFTACGAHQRGHFLLSSGLHSADYLQCALYLAHPRRAAEAGQALGHLLAELGAVPDVVVAPAMGGLIIGHEVARALDRPFIFTERADGSMVLRRGFSVARGQKLVVIEDVVTTGRSTREVITILEALGGDVLAVASVVNRSGSTDPFAGLPYGSLMSAEFATWSAEACPLCAAGEAITKPGSRPVA